MPRRVSKMLDNEKTAELKRNCELLLEFIELINELSMQAEVLKKEKQYYMDEYKKTSDKLHSFISNEKLLEMILYWYEENRSGTIHIGGIECDLFTDEPDFVTEARKQKVELLLTK
jgi:hypothetical protein